MSKSKDKSRRINKKLLNFLFVFFGLCLVVFLALAPEESTTRLPHDDIHQIFHGIKSKKEADQQCVSCHGESAGAPLPDNHPPPYRCLFCHKRDQ